MFNKLHSVLTSRLASMMLAAVLLAALTAPFVMLQSMHAFAGTPSLPCTVGNYNGCTELSATPPQDIPAVPPNMVLMFDDSGSMNWDYMPDWSYLSDTANTPAINNSANTPNGPRDVAVNSLYYDPTVTYVAPPKADGTNYPSASDPSPKFSFGSAYFDGFNTALGKKNVAAYTASYTAPATGSAFPYYTTLTTQIASSSTDSQSPTSLVCQANYTPDPTKPAVCNVIDPSTPPSYAATSTDSWTCNSGDGSPDASHKCTHVDKSGEVAVTTYYYPPNVPKLTCPTGGSLSGSICKFSKPAATVASTGVCSSGYSWNASTRMCVKTTTIAAVTFNAFTYVTGTKGNYTQHYVALAANSCSAVVNSVQAATCVSETDTSGASAPNGVAAGQNIANWFSYYRTRLLMSKSGLMRGLTNLDPGYRFGFASINGNATSTIPAGSSSTPAPYAFDDSMASGTGGNANNKLAAVQPFGDGSSGSQKANFWNWLAAEKAAGETPLRKALNAAGTYYQTSQPWSTMKGDPGYTPGSTAQFACRASYTVLTTDGFWNGDDPGVSGMANAADSDGPPQTVPAGNPFTKYLAKPPFGASASAIGGTAGSGVSSLADVATYYWENDLQTGMPNEVKTSKSDPAAWQHMTTYTIGLGFQPVNIKPSSATPAIIFGWAHALDAFDSGLSPTNLDPTDPAFAWPNPSQLNAAGLPLGNENNIADLVHTAVNGHGDYFNVTNPQDLVNAFGNISTQIGGSNASAAAGTNASVLALGAATFQVGYDTTDWSGSLKAITLKTDGSIDATLWDAGGQLDAAYHSSTGYSSRKNVYSGAYAAATGTYTPFQFNAANKASLDSTETTGLESPVLAGGIDTLDNRINYLLGDTTYEGTTLNYRVRSSILGAILHAEPVYVAGATGNYRDSWPTFGTYTPPEAVPLAQTFAAFVSAEATRESMVYLAANDGMLHAFYAPVPTCTGTIDANGDCSAYTFPSSTNQGNEAWAFVPRAAYANLGNLTTLNNFRFRPTVDGTPVTRDVFFSEAGTYNNQWRTILAGGMGLGGRGVYGLDITDPTAFSASSVLWEFDSDMTVDGACATNDGTACKGTDLGYTVAQPNVGRLANGRWVVLVPNGYFPDCTTPDFPTADQTSCQAIAAQAPKDSSGKPYSALFVLDAQTGKMIAELKTPTGLGVTSFGLAKPVLGDYDNDQVDDVAFAGDVQGNLWRFDMRDPRGPAYWTVTLVYKGLTDASGNQGVQPITTMPRLFPDPTTNRFMVLFGTGKYLGVGDNSNGADQAIIAVRDVAGTTYSQTDLQPQYIHETVVPTLLPDGTVPPNAGATLRCVTGSSSNDCTTAINTVTSGAGGWFVTLVTTDSSGVRNDSGERVVVNPAAIFASNTVIFETLITGALNTDACDPATQGALMAFNAITGGSGGVSSLGGQNIVGGRITSGRTSGSLPTVSALGGGKVIPLGPTLAPGNTPISIDAPIWRRRSWRVLLNDQ